MLRWDVARLMTHWGVEMHRGINSSVAVLRLRAHCKAWSCVCVCGLISKAPQDALAEMRRIWKLSDITCFRAVQVSKCFFFPWLVYFIGNKVANWWGVCFVWAYSWAWKMLSVLNHTFVACESMIWLVCSCGHRDSVVLLQIANCPLCVHGLSLARAHVSSRFKTGRNPVSKLQGKNLQLVS